MIKWKVNNIHHWSQRIGNVWFVYIRDSNDSIVATGEFSKEEMFKRINGRYMDINTHPEKDDELLEFIENA